ncbi:MAG: hypothetical protein WCG99_03460 [Candidatus Berkelbacteria bacterium]
MEPNDLKPAAKFSPWVIIVPILVIAIGIGVYFLWPRNKSETTETNSTVSESVGSAVLVDATGALIDKSTDTSSWEKFTVSTKDKWNFTIKYPKDSWQPQEMCDLLTSKRYALLPEDQEDCGPLLLQDFDQGENTIDQTFRKMFSKEPVNYLHSVTLQSGAQARHAKIIENNLESYYYFFQLGTNVIVLYAPTSDEQFSRDEVKTALQIINTMTF